MQLEAMPVQNFLETLASDAPAPGGGSASALSGAQGAALVAMVARLSVGRKAYESAWALCGEAAERADALRAALAAQITRDSDSYLSLAEAFRLPKNTDAEKAARRAAIDAATLNAARVPLGTMELCAQGLQAARTLQGNSNKSAASDLKVAALLLHAGLEGAFFNVRINLDGREDAESLSLLARAAALRDAAAIDSQALLLES